MTRRLLRVVLAWLLAVALPLQGYAVHAMSACGPAHTSMIGARAAAPSHHHDGAAQGLEAEEHDHAAMVHHGATAAPDAQTEDPHGTAGKCAACASCCHAVAITTSVLQTDVVRLVPVYVATVPTAHARVLTGGLERPPRAALA